MIGKALAKLAVLKAKRPHSVGKIDTEHTQRAVEVRRKIRTRADKIAERLRGIGYQVYYGYDADIGDWAEAVVDGKTVARVNRCGNITKCLLTLAGELGVSIDED